MLELEQALQRILSVVRPLGSEFVAIRDSAGRVLADPIFSPVDLPLFDNSAVDGYAVRAGNLKGASADHPTNLRSIGQAPAGEAFGGAIEDGTCVRVFTGSPLPNGADAAIMQEDTRSDPTQPGQLRCLETVKLWENVRLQGEDLKRGAKLADAGSRLTAGRVALLAAAGMSEIQAARRPRVTVAATGNELVDNGASLAPGKIYESNRVMLATLMIGAGVIPIILPLVPDTLEATRTALEKALAECDAVVTSGGVSVGDCDFVRAAFEELGGELSFWRISVKPGKPFAF